MEEQLAVLRLGYLSHSLRSIQRSMWTGSPLELPGVRPSLREIERALHLLGGRQSGYQRATFCELRERVAARHRRASDALVELVADAVGEVDLTSAEPLRQLATRVSSDELAQACRRAQEADWEEIHSLLAGVAQGDLRPWWVIGDHLGDVVRRLVEGTLPVPLPPEQWDYLYEGVDRLPGRVRPLVEERFPSGYRSAAHLGLSLVGTFRSLCALLADEGARLLQRPYWDGEALWFGSALIKRFKKPAENQRRALAAFQAEAFAHRIPNPFRAGHTSLDSAVETCKRTAENLNDDHVTPNVMRFGHARSGDYLCWQAVVP